MDKVVITALIVAVATTLSAFGAGFLAAQALGTHSYKTRARAFGIGLLAGFVMLWCQTWLVLNGSLT